MVRGMIESGGCKLFIYPLFTAFLYWLVQQTLMAVAIRPILKVYLSGLAISLILPATALAA